ncbi:hypothetical protein PSYCG_12905 [Psychrobacter sp. G]|nr:hypothetical protein PSYCG_12905 [Psychrobacter sp. G]
MTLMKIFLGLHNGKIYMHKIYMYQFMRIVQHQEMDCIDCMGRPVLDKGI